MRRRPLFPLAAALAGLVALLAARGAAAQASVLTAVPVRGQTAESGRPLEIAVHLSPASVTVSVQTVDVTATGGVDYVRVDRALTFPPGTTTASVPVIPLDDASDEDRTESLLVLLTEARGATLAMASVDLTIEDDDEEVSVTAIAGEEGGAARLVLERRWPSVLPVSFLMALEPGTAVEGDYLAAGVLAPFAPDDLVRTLEVPLVDDGVDEPTETFVARFEAVAASPGGTVVLTPPAVSVDVLGDAACAPSVADRAFCAEVTGEVSRVLEGPFVRRDGVVGHAPSSSCQYRTPFETDDGWRITVAADLPHLEPGEAYPVRTPVVRDGNALLLRRWAEGAVSVTAESPGGEEYYGRAGTLTFSAFDARFGRHEGRPVAGRLVAELERLDVDLGHVPYGEDPWDERTVVGTLDLDLRFASDHALVPLLQGDCGRPD